MLKVVSNDEASSSCWCQYPFIAITYRQDTCICKQMSHVLRCLEMIGFPHYCFIKVCGVEADSKLKVANIVFPSTSTKLVKLWGLASCTGFKTPTFSILSTYCLKSSFMYTRTGLQGVCLGLIFGSHWMKYGGPRKHPIPSKTSGYLYKIFSLLVTNLGTRCCGSNIVTAFF